MPRTGGSTLWHYLARNLSGRLEILDLYYEAQRLSGHEQNALSVLAERAWLSAYAKVDSLLYAQLGLSEYRQQPTGARSAAS